MAPLYPPEEIIIRSVFWTSARALIRAPSPGQLIPPFYHFTRRDWAAAEPCRRTSSSGSRGAKRSTRRLIADHWITNYQCLSDYWTPCPTMLVSTIRLLFLRGDLSTRSAKKPDRPRNPRFHGQACSGKIEKRARHRPARDRGTYPACPRTQIEAGHPSSPGRPHRCKTDAFRMQLRVR